MVLYLHRLLEKHIHIVRITQEYTRAPELKERKKYGSTNDYLSSYRSYSSTATERQQSCEHGQLNRP